MDSMFLIGILLKFTFEKLEVILGKLWEKLIVRIGQKAFNYIKKSLHFWAQITENSKLLSLKFTFFLNRKL